MHGDRRVAETYYRRVLSLPDAAGSRDVAERYLDRPFGQAEITELVGGPTQAR